MPGYDGNSRWRDHTHALPTDRDLVGKALSGEKAFRRLTENYRRAVFGYLEWFLLHHKLAADKAAAAEASVPIWEELTLRLAGKLAERWGKGGVSFRDLLCEGIHEACHAWSKPATRSLMGPPADGAPAMNTQMRQDLLGKAWERLRSYQRENEAKGNRYFALLRLWDEHRGESQEALNDRLHRQAGGRRMEAAAFRQTLRRGRNLFARYLCDEVALTLSRSDGFTLDAFVQECQNLDIIDDYLNDTRYYKELFGPEAGETL